MRTMETADRVSTHTGPAAHAEVYRRRFWFNLIVPVVA